jgi:hypothetical protein
MKTRRRRDLALLAVVASAAALGAMGSASCSSKNTTGSSGQGGSSSGTNAGGAGGEFIGNGPNPDGPFADFPAEPQVDSTLTPDVVTLFEGTPGGAPGGPCLAEPPLEALVPTNWTPLRFEWVPPAGLNVFELKLSVENQTNELKIYTPQPIYTIPPEIWSQLMMHSAGRDVHVTLRGAQIEAGQIVAGPLVGADGVVHIAPVAAPGAIVYWTSSGGTALKGFTIGDTDVKTVIAPQPVGADTNCVSCHTSSPDGLLSFFTHDRPGIRAVTARKVDGTVAPPSDMQVSATALSLLGRDHQAAPTLSGMHYKPNDAVAVTVFIDPAVPGSQYQLVWTDLHATDPNTGWGVLPRVGDPRQPASPTWWHDGSTIAYTSSIISGEGVVSGITDADTTMDIYTVPYNNRQGGQAAPMPGASDPGYLEYYPVISPNDTMLAFNRFAPYKFNGVNWADSYDEPMAEVFVVRTTGGEPVRVAANDPPACVGRPSPGITNSWPRWAPSAEVFNGKKYYWLTFSSKRRDGVTPQLFVSGVVTRFENGAETIEATYPALYVTSQVAQENNHTPAWDVFQIQPPK